METKRIAFVGFPQYYANRLLYALRRKRLTVFQQEIGTTLPHLVLYNGMQDMEEIAKTRQQFPTVPMLVVGKTFLSNHLLAQLSKVSARWLDESTSFRQLVTSVNTLLTGLDMLAEHDRSEASLASLAKRVDKRGNGKNLFTVPRLEDAIIETGFYWLKAKNGSNMVFRGGSYGSGTQVQRKFSVCLSTAAGCQLAESQTACLHCLTGVGKFAGLLTAHEIIDQFVWTVKDSPGTHRIRLPYSTLHASFMGEGEPLQNMPQVLEAIHYLNRSYKLSFSLSTVGLYEPLRHLLKTPWPDISLQPQLSGHYYDKRREEFLPAVTGNDSLQHTLPLALAWAQKLGQQLVINTVMIGGPEGWENNRAQDARNLVELCRKFDPQLTRIRFKVSTFNGGAKGLKVRFVAGKNEQFVQELKAHGITPQILRNLGISKEAGCGTLRTQILKL